MLMATTTASFCALTFYFKYLYKVRKHGIIEYLLNSKHEPRDVNRNAGGVGGPDWCKCYFHTQRLHGFLEIVDRLLSDPSTSLQKYPSTLVPKICKKYEAVQLYNILTIFFTFP